MEMQEGAATPAMKKCVWDGCCHEFLLSARRTRCKTHRQMYTESQRPVQERERREKERREKTETDKQREKREKEERRLKAIESIHALPPLHLCRANAGKKTPLFGAGGGAWKVKHVQASVTPSLLAPAPNLWKEEKEEEEEETEGGEVEEEEEEDVEKEEQHPQHHRKEEEEEEGLHEQDELRPIGFFSFHEPPHLRRPQQPYYHPQHPYYQRIDDDGTTHFGIRAPKDYYTEPLPPQHQPTSQDLKQSPQLLGDISSDLTLTYSSSAMDHSLDSGAASAGQSKRVAL